MSKHLRLTALPGIALCAAAFLFSGCLQEPVVQESKNELAQAAATVGDITLREDFLPPGQDFWIAGKTVSLNAFVTFSSYVSKIEFFRDGVKLGEMPKANTNSYTFNYVENNAGGYNYTAKLTERSGATKTSPLLPVYVWFQYKRSFVPGQFIIPDGVDGAGIPMTIPSSPSQKVRDIRVKLYIKHTYLDDLYIVFMNTNPLPAIQCAIANRVGGSGDDFGYIGGSVFEPTVFRDDASKSIGDPGSLPPYRSSYKPSESLLNKFWGKPANGDWLVWIKDLAKYDIGEIRYVEVDVKAGP